MLITDFESKAFKQKKYDSLHLSIWISPYHVKVALVSEKKNECLKLLVYDTNDFETTCGVEALEQILDSNTFLSEIKKSAVTLCISGEDYTLIPSSFCKNLNCAKDFLAFSSDFNDKEYTTVYHENPDVKCIVAFAISNKLIAWFDAKYKSLNRHVLHQANVLISAFLQHTAKNSFLRDENRIYVFTEAKHIDILVIKNLKVTYFGRTDYSNDEDILNSVIHVISIFALNENPYEVILWSDFDKKSDLYKNMYRTFDRVTTQAKTEILWFKKTLKHLVQISHFDVISAHMCNPSSSGLISSENIKSS